MSATHDKGVLRLDQGQMSWSQAGTTYWSVSFMDVRIVAEVTTEAGFETSDWFFVLVDFQANQYWFPIDARGIETFREEYVRVCGDRLETMLGNSVGFRSSALWPQPLRGRPLFAVKRVRRRSWLGRAIGLLIPRLELELTDEMRSYISNLGESVDDSSSAGLA